MNAPLLDTYLLDTNVVSDIARQKETSPSPPCVVRLESAKERGAKILIPVVSVAEVEYGLQAGSQPDGEKAKSLRQFLAGFLHEPFEDAAIESYGLIRAWLFGKYGTPKSKPKSRGLNWMEKLPEALKDRTTGMELGIDERDLLIACTAIGSNYVLVTRDANQGMKRIQEAADALAAGHPTQLRIEDWHRPLR